MVQLNVKNQINIKNYFENVKIFKNTLVSLVLILIGNCNF